MDKKKKKKLKRVRRPRNLHIKMKFFYNGLIPLVPHKPRFIDGRDKNLF